MDLLRPDMETATTTSRLMLYSVCRALGRRIFSLFLAAMAKVVAAENAIKTVNSALQLARRARLRRRLPNRADGTRRPDVHHPGALCGM